MVFGVTESSGVQLGSLTLGLPRLCPDKQRNSLRSGSKRGFLPLAPSSSPATQEELLAATKGIQFQGPGKASWAAIMGLHAPAPGFQDHQAMQTWKLVPRRAWIIQTAVDGELKKKLDSDLYLLHP